MDEGSENKTLSEVYDMSETEDVKEKFTNGIIEEKTATIDDVIIQEDSLFQYDVHENPNIFATIFFAMQVSFPRYIYTSTSTTISFRNTK